MSTRSQVLRAHHALLNGSGELSYFERRRIATETIEQAHVGYEAGAFTYPSITREGALLGLHFKSKARDAKGKRRQWWEGFADDLPSKGHGKKPDEPAKVIPFGLETLKDLEPASPIILCCGEEDALSLRQASYTSVSQPGAGLLEPVYAKEFAGSEVVVFYDAGEEQEARKDALKLLKTGAEGVRVVEWPSETPHGTDINSRLVEYPQGFEGWAAEMIEEAKPLELLGTKDEANRKGEPDLYVTPMPEPPRWPTLAEEALYGLPGEIVRTIEPHTEADPVAILVNVLVAFGNAAGGGAFFKVGAERHHLKLNAALVGETSKARKGTSWAPIRELMHAADKEWAEERVASGLSSGEGLIYAVRDEVKGKDKKGEEVILDEGVQDKRLFVLESELAGMLKVMAREGNTLSPVVRQAWDDGRLQVMTRNNPMKATEAHVSIVGHITREELLRHLTETESANGFANRFLWFMVRRSKQLPFGGEWYKVNTAPLVKRLSSALEFGSALTEIIWGESAREVWQRVYAALSEGKPGLFGAVVGRAEAQVVRLATLYAVMDESYSIEYEHLTAALALWDYAETSARYVFGDATGDPVADQIMEALRVNGKDGMTRTEISHLFGRNKKAERINQALALLLKSTRARRAKESTEGKAAERWFLL